MKIILPINQKDRVAKRTSTINLASALSQLGKKVLVIDIDLQGNATTELLLETNKLEEYIIRNGKYDIIETTINLASCKHEMSNKFLRESLLRKKFKIILAMILF